MIEMGIHQTIIGLKSLDKVNWQGKTVLDIGCGDGKLSLRVLEKTKCKKIIGIDISKENIERAKKIKESRLEFIVSDASKLPFNDESFDAIFCNIAFQLFDNKETALKEIFRTLKNGEVILNYIEEKTSILRSLERILSKPPFSKFVKIKGKGNIKMSKGDFDKLAKNVGFSKVKSISKKDLIYYKTLDSLLFGYRNTIETKIKKLPKRLKIKAKEELEKGIKVTKTKKGFPENWRIVFARLVK